MWGRSAFAIAVVVVLIALGLTNIGMRARWHEVEDGVLRGARPEGVTALEVSGTSSGAAAGIQRGDVLLAINGAAVPAPADVIEYQHRGREGTRPATLLRLGSGRGSRCR